MRYTAELAARAEAWLALPLEQKRGGDGSGLRELGAIWATMQGLPPVSCAQCQYSERARDLATYVRDYHRFILSPDPMSDSKYTFAPQYAGETIVHGGYNKAVTAENLTDDDAKALLKLGYGHVIVKKGAADAAPAADASTNAGGEQGAEPSEAEKALQVKLNEATATATKAGESEKKAKADLAEAKKALKTEQTAHKATADELATVKQQLADTAEKLAEALKPKE